MSDTQTPDCGRKLLAVLDASVRSESGLSGLQGRIAVGVESAAGVVWWIVTFLRGRTETEFTTVEPTTAHASLLLGERRARTWLGHEPEGQNNRLTIRGSRPLLERFVARYLEPRSLLSVRLQLQQR